MNRNQLIPILLTSPTQTLLLVSRSPAVHQLLRPASTLPRRRPSFRHSISSLVSLPLHRPHPAASNSLRHSNPGRFTHHYLSRARSLTLSLSRSVLSLCLLSVGHSPFFSPATRAGLARTSPQPTCKSAISIFARPFSLHGFRTAEIAFPEFQSRPRARLAIAPLCTPLQSPFGAKLVPHDFISTRPASFHPRR